MPKKLNLNRETLSTLQSRTLEKAEGGIGPLTIGPGCATNTCKLTFGTWCPTHDCNMTFGPCQSFFICITH